MPPLYRLLPVLAILTAACGTSAQSNGPIVVPPPASPQVEPTPLDQGAINIEHVHAIASRDGGHTLLLGTHHGLLVTGPGVASPRPVGQPGLVGDVLALFYTADGQLFAGGHNLGVQVSHDDGRTWTQTSAAMLGADVHGLAQDPTHPGQLYAYAVGKGLLVSPDYGAHWSHRPGEADNTYISGLAVTADGTLLVGTPGKGVAASTDRGSSYVVVRDNTGPVYSLAASPTDANVVLVAAENGIFLTGDGGKTWNAGETNVAVTGVAIDARDPHRFYAGGADGGVAVSTDAGITWKPL